MSDIEKCTIVVVVRDRFSTTKKCLDHIIRNTPEPYEFIAVMDGAPANVQSELKKDFEGKVRFLFGPRLLNPSESRNVGLREVKTRLAMLMDNDVFVRPGWLAPLIRCLNETGAAMVVPIVLDEENEIHTAGNDLYITYKNGQAFGCKELRYGRQAFYENCNLKREPTGYGELHCQLVVAETARKLGVYDEKLREVGEVDSGLTWAKAGCTMWFEPASVVYFYYPVRITHVEDIPPFLFKWDTAAIAAGYEHFKKKWNIDITEGGRWLDFLVILNAKLGLVPRMFPSRFGLFLDECGYQIKSWFGIPRKLLRALKAQLLGYGEWFKK